MTILKSDIPYRPDLQLLRGVSVLLVFLYHLKIDGFSNGYLGVDIFFVVSGFLMATLVDRVCAQEFYKRRLRRLILPYLVTICATTIATVFLTFPVDANQRIERLLFDLVALSNFVFWAENSYFNSSAFRPLLNLWSLSVEMQFYLVAPFLIPFLRRRKILLVALLVVSLMGSMFLLTVSPKTSFFMMPTRLWEFLFGVYAVLLSSGYKELGIDQLLRSFLVLCIFVVVFFYPLPQDSLSIANGHPSVAALIVVVATTGLLVLRIDELISINSVISKLLIKLGDWSYSIYLTHFPIIVLVNYEPFGGTKLGFKTAWELMFIVALTAIFSYLLFNYVEKLRHTKKIAIPAFGAVLGCLLLSVYGETLNGVKFSEKEMLIFNAWKDRASYRCGKLKRILHPAANTCLLAQGSGGRRVLLLGNSHSDSLKVAFSEAVSNSEMSTYFYVANNPLMSEEHNEKVVAEEVVENKIDAVVIHYNSSFFDNNQYLSSLKSLVQSLKSSDVDVYFIAPVPVYETHVPKAMLSDVNEPDFEFPDTTLSDYFSKNSNFFNFVSKNNIEPKFLALPHLLMCSSNACNYSEGGVPYYFDGGHLTLTGARSLEPLLKDLADKLRDDE